MTGKQFKEVFETCGFQTKEIANLLGRSRWWVRNLIKTSEVPLRWEMKLKEIVGEEAFTRAMQPHSLEDSVEVYQTYAEKEAAMQRIWKKWEGIDFKMEEFLNNRRENDTSA